MDSSGINQADKGTELLFRSYKIKPSGIGQPSYLSNLVLILVIRRSLLVATSLLHVHQFQKTSYSRIQNLFQKINHLTPFRKCMCMQESISAKYG
jgi:hypothetical protein